MGGVATVEVMAAAMVAGMAVVTVEVTEVVTAEAMAAGTVEATGGPTRALAHHRCSPMRWR